jgi:MFS family permease
MSAWQACNTVTCFFAGTINVRLGTRWTVVLGTLVAVLTTVLVPAMHSLPSLFLLRALHGVGQGIAFPVLMAAALSAVPDERRTASMGFFQAIYGLFADSLGLVSTFYLIGALSLASALAAGVLLPHRVRSYEASG